MSISRFSYIVKRFPASDNFIAPMGTHGGRYPWRVPCEFDGKQGQVILDQLRTVDKSRLVRRMGALSDDERAQVLDVLARMFAP